MSAMYGHDISPTDDCVGLAEQAVGKLTESVFLGALVVNTFPILRHLPPWFPGAGFKHFAKESKVLTDQMQVVPMELVKKNMVNDNGPFFSLWFLSFLRLWVYPPQRLQPSF